MGRAGRSGHVQQRSGTGRPRSTWDGPGGPGRPGNSAVHAAPRGRIVGNRTESAQGGSGITYASHVIDEPTTKPRSTLWRELPILLGVAVVVAVLVRAFVLQTFFIPSESMENTLLINDRVLVNKLVYDFRDPRRGEVIVFTSPVEWRTDQNEKDFIKRVIGVPG